MRRYVEYFNRCVNVTNKKECYFMLLFVYIFIVLSAITINCYFHKIARYLDSKERIERARFWSNLTVAVNLLTIIIILIIMSNNIIKKSWLILSDLMLLIVMCSELVFIFKTSRYLRFADNKIIANHFASMCSKYINDKKEEQAIEAIKIACESDTEEPLHWLTYSLCEPDIPKAKEHLQFAEKLIEEKTNPSKEELSKLEFCKGSILAGQGQFDGALQCLHISLGICFSNETSEFIKLVEQQRQIKR